MNFTIHFYETIDSVSEKWGKMLSNGSATGLIGDMVKIIKLHSR